MKIPLNEILKEGITLHRRGTYIKLYKPNLTPNDIVKAMDKGIIDFITIDREKFIVMTEKTRNMSIDDSINISPQLTISDIVQKGITLHQSWKFIAKYHEGLRKFTIQYAMTHGKIDYCVIDGQKLIVLTKNTKRYRPNRWKGKR